MKIVNLNKELLEEANIPPKYWPLGIETYFGNPTALEKTKTYVKKIQVAFDNGVGLFFFSAHPQTCKTFLGTLILKSVLAKGYSARYSSLIDIARQYVGEGDTDHSLRQLYGAVDFVFIDDLVEAPNKAERNGIERIVLMRSTAGLPTLVASSISLGEVAEHYGNKTAYRFGTLTEIDTSYANAAFSVDRQNEEAKSQIWGGTNVG